jgi:hypothetical protein
MKYINGCITCKHFIKSDTNSCIEITKYILPHMATSDGKNKIVIITDPYNFECLKYEGLKK